MVLNEKKKNKFADMMVVLLSRPYLALWIAGISMSIILLAVIYLMVGNPELLSH